jgi:hypothetical protein
MQYPVQGSLDLKVEKEVEIDGVGMGVLSDGTPYLTGRGLARFCGVDSSVITRLGVDWSEQLQKPRITRIRQILELRGVNHASPYIEFNGNRYWTGAVCVAVLEYYALDATTTNDNSKALYNYRTLAGRGFDEFIYTQVGYDPSQSVPDQWKQFHDRVSLNHNSVPTGHFSIFKEIADIIVTLGQAGLHIDDKFVPDISVGRTWSTHWKNNNLAGKYGERSTYLHHYPDYFPQAASNPQEPLCYPEAALGEFRRWFREVYVGEGKFKNYLNNQAKAKALPASFSQIALEALKK